MGMGTRLWFIGQVDGRRSEGLVQVFKEVVSLLGSSAVEGFAGFAGRFACGGLGGIIHYREESGVWRIVMDGDMEGVI